MTLTVPQRHHYVPQLLLRRFADHNRKLLVHRSDQKEPPRWAPVKKTAQTLCGHTLYWPGQEPDHVTVEAGMGEIESATGKVIADLLTNNVRTPSAQQREVLSFFIALQSHRSRFFIEMLETGVLDPDEPIDEAAKSMAVRAIMRSVLWPWAARHEEESDPGEIRCSMADHLQYGPWNWHLYRPTGPKLLIGDNVVCMWGIAADATSEMPEAWTRHGVGVGFANCGRITVPLASNLGLIIHRTNRPDLRSVPAAMFNRATIYNSREFVAHHPDGLPDSALRSALLKDLWTQRQILPIIIEATRSAAQKDAQRTARHRLPFEQPF